MLFDRGPLDLIPEGAFPRAASAPSLVAVVAAAVDSFNAHEAALGATGAHVAGGLTSDLPGAGAGELAAATSWTNDATTASTSAIANALQAADSLQGDLPGIVLGIDPGMFGLAPQFVPPPTEGGGSGVDPGPPQL